MLHSLVVAALLACAQDVTKDKVAATVSEPAVAPAMVPPTPVLGVPADAPPGLPFDIAASSLKVKGAKVTKSHDVVFSDFSGSYVLQGEEVRSIRVAVKTAALSTDSEKLASHLRSDDFLNSEVIPEATFSGEISAGGLEGKGTHTVKGKMSLHGIEKELSFPATIEVTATEIKGQAEFSINRHDFGIAYPGKPDDLIQDGVVFNVSLVSKR